MKKSDVLKLPSMPLQSPTFPRGPYRFFRRQYLVISYASDPAAIRAALRRAGLRRYEVSNFARPGFESVHNRLYWSGESYLGLGAGAAGCRRACAAGWC